MLVPNMFTMHMAGYVIHDLPWSKACQESMSSCWSGVIRGHQTLCFSKIETPSDSGNVFDASFNEMSKQHLFQPAAVNSAAERRSRHFRSHGKYRSFISCFSEGQKVLPQQLAKSAPLYLQRNGREREENLKTQKSALKTSELLPRTSGPRGWGS